jgi:hypothetical protein
MITMADIIRGSKKCSEKNRVSVGCLTENPPHIHSTSVFPKYGIAEKMFVITVAPQNDICPHGRTYPRNAVAINRISRIIPEDHTSFFVFWDEKSIPRIICI